MDKRMQRSLILAAALSALAAGPALAQEGGLDEVEMSITIAPVTDVADVGGSTDLSVDTRDRSDEAGEYHILLPLHDDRDGDRDRDREHDAERDHEHDMDHAAERDHERDMDRGTDLDLDTDHGDLGGDLGGEVDLPDTPDMPDTPDTDETERD